MSVDLNTEEEALEEDVVASGGGWEEKKEEEGKRLRKDRGEWRRKMGRSKMGKSGRKEGGWRCSWRGEKRGTRGGEEEEAQLRVVLSANDVPNVRPVGNPVGGGHEPRVITAETPRLSQVVALRHHHRFKNSNGKAESPFWKLS